MMEGEQGCAERRIGNIRLTEELGRDGRGAECAGFDERLQRRVAVKAIGNERRLDPATRTRFLREARILAQLSHPHVCTVFDLVDDGDTDLLVLEFVAGRTLREELEQGLDGSRAMALALREEALPADHPLLLNTVEFHSRLLTALGDGDGARGFQARAEAMRAAAAGE